MRRLNVLFFASLMCFVAICTVGSFRITFIRPRHPSSSLSMTKMDNYNPPPLLIVARDMDLTAGMSYQIQHSIGKVLDKLGSDVISTHVVLRLLKYPVTETHSYTTKKGGHIAEVTVSCKGGVVLHASEHSDHMQSSIESVAHKIAGMIKKHNEKVHRKHFRQSLSKGESDDEELDLESEYVEPPSNPLAVESTITLDQPLDAVRPKAFDMPPISVDDAITAFALIDHPFYVFRNKETNEINVLYRRKAGGVGVIMPRTTDTS